MKWILANKRKIVFVTFLVLLMISAISVIAEKNTYTKHVFFLSPIKNVQVKLDTEKHIEYKGFQVENGILSLEFEGKAPGKTDVEIHIISTSPAENQNLKCKLYTNFMNKVTENNYIGIYSGLETVTICEFVFFTVLAGLLFLSFFDAYKKAKYSTKMVKYLGFSMFFIAVLVFFEISLISTGKTFMEAKVLAPTKELLNAAPKLIIVLSPLVGLFFVLITISNVSLIRKEGLKAKNLFGVAVGVLAIGGLILHVAFNYYADHAKNIVLYNTLYRTFSAIYCYFISMLFSTILCAALAAKHVPTYPRDAVIILGCKMRNDGTLTPLLQGRVDLAIKYATDQMAESGRKLYFIPSGGKGNNEVISEGMAMEKYLLSQKIPKEQVFSEIESKNTLQNFKFSKKVLEKEGIGNRIIFSTTNYHVFRGYILAEKSGMENIEGIGAKTKWYFWPNAFMREFIGLLEAEKRRHLRMLTFILIIYVPLSIIAGQNMF